MSEMTATRTVLALATLVLAALGWALAARALWATEVPDGLDLRPVAEHYFLPGEPERAARHDAFLRIDFLLALAAWRAPQLERRIPGPRLVRGLGLGLAAFGAAWLVRLPFGVAAHWWDRRYDL